VPATWSHRAWLHGRLSGPTNLIYYLDDFENETPALDNEHEAPEIRDELLKSTETAQSNISFV
jgi:hypothetical protein